MEMSLDQDITIGCAFRYALGSRTYVVDSVCNVIEQEAYKISQKTRYRMIREIDEAIKMNQAGMQMDVSRWMQCRTILKESLQIVES